MSHFIKVCKLCEAVISQCRCPSEDKVKEYGICEKCANKEPKTKRELCLKALDCLSIQVPERVAVDIKKTVLDYITELEQPKCSCGRQMWSYCSVCNPR